MNIDDFDRRIREIESRLLEIENEVRRMYRILSELWRRVEREHV